MRRAAPLRRIVGAFRTSDTAPGGERRVHEHGLALTVDEAVPAGAKEARGELLGSLVPTTLIPCIYPVSLCWFCSWPNPRWPTRRAGAAHEKILKRPERILNVAQTPPKDPTHQ